MEERTPTAQSDWDLFPFQLFSGNPAYLFEKGFFLEGFFSPADALNAIRGAMYIVCRDAEAQLLLNEENKYRRRRRAELTDSIVNLKARQAKHQRLSAKAANEMEKALLERESLVCFPD